VLCFLENKKYEMGLKNQLRNNSYLLNMKKKLTLVGNSKAVILPVQMVKKLGGDKVVIEETEGGILIRSASKSSFQRAVERFRKNKTSIYKRMELQASDPETIRYYSNPVNKFSDVDLTIIEE
jgi:antitoxin component of MazEF toxin-antitoxin module